MGIQKRVLISINGEKVCIRSSTPDIIVAASSLYYCEYSELEKLSPKVVIDAGANIGTSAIWFARKFPNAKIVAVEPESENFDLLVKNVKTFENVIPLRAALGRELGKLKLLDRKTGPWGYSVCEESGDAELEEVDSVTVRSIMDKFGIERVCLLKMDIEGGEKDVLENSNQWIDNVDTMTVELHDRIVMGCDRAWLLGNPVHLKNNLECHRWRDCMRLGAICSLT